jgi:pyruvate/2-oxoglutarate dehydrogenase complex dihydrolipoamide acyltransferase (E2) component
MSPKVAKAAKAAAPAKAPKAAAPAKAPKAAVAAKPEKAAKPAKAAKAGKAAKGSEEDVTEGAEGVETVDQDEIEEAEDEAAAAKGGGGDGDAALAAASSSGEMSASFKNFRHHPDMENFYRFIYENDLRHEALGIIDKIMVEKLARRAGKGGKSAH